MHSHELPLSRGKGNSLGEVSKIPGGIPAYIRSWICVGVLFALVSCGEKASVEPVKLEGAGATFPVPLYAKWFKDYGRDHSDVQISYDGIGSGGGVKNFVDHTVDFGASDAAMSEDEMERVDPSLGVQLLPMTASCIVLTYNLPGVSQLKLSRTAYAGIFLGKITRWNDPVIVKDNASEKLPAMPINLVVRSDTSGTTFALTKHLSAVSDAFAASLGVSKMPDWTVGARSKGNDGIANTVQTTPGSLGYVVYGSASKQHLPMALLENKSGAFVAASTASGLAALGSALLPDDLIAWVPDPKAKEAYPIVTYTWMLCYKRYDKKKHDALIGLLDYSLGSGQKDAEPLGYIPLPAPVIAKVRAALQTITVS